jgi:hypothetical protein
MDMHVDVVKGTSIAKLYKFNDPDGLVERLARIGIPVECLIEVFRDRFIEVRESRGNVFLNEGINYIWMALNGQSITPFNNANSYIGVGDGSAAADPSQTGLQGTNKLYKPMDSGYPTISGTSMIFQATFGADEANWTWNEWTVANGSSDNAINLNRKVENLGTKSSGATWILQVSVKIT